MFELSMLNTELYRSDCYAREKLNKGHARSEALLQLYKNQEEEKGSIFLAVNLCNLTV